MTDFQKIGVVGGGAWGSALAQSLTMAGRDVILWAFEIDTIEEINEFHTNRNYLPGVTLDRSIRATGKLGEIAACDAVLMVAPAQHVRVISGELGQHIETGLPLIICSKGIEQKTGQLLSAVVSEMCPQARIMALSGPTFASEIARGLPAALTLACEDEETGQALMNAIGHKVFRPYWSDDLVGVQVGGALKNVLAIAAGIVDGKKMGNSAHAALVTRGFGELVQFGEAYGGRRETLMGLSGIGDLLLTCSSEQSRNMSLGRALGLGQSLEEILGGRKSVSEGVYTASAAWKIGQDHNLDVPITDAVHRVLEGEVSVDEAIDDLLTRPFSAEI